MISFSRPRLKPPIFRVAPSNNQPTFDQDREDLLGDQIYQ
jgi:hypothetical protein